MRRIHADEVAPTSRNAIATPTTAIVDDVLVSARSTTPDGGLDAAATAAFVVEADAGWVVVDAEAVGDVEVGGALEGDALADAGAGGLDAVSATGCFAADCVEAEVVGAYVGAAVEGWAAGVVGVGEGLGAALMKMLPVISIGGPAPSTSAVSGSRPHASVELAHVAVAVLTYTWISPARHVELLGSQVQAPDEPEQVPPASAAEMPVTRPATEETPT